MPTKKTGPVFDCATLFHGGRAAGGVMYAHEYDEYLAFFRLLGHARVPYAVHNAPVEWVPFIEWMGHRVASWQGGYYPPEEGWIGVMNWVSAIRNKMADRRRVVEVASTTRPELVHALYLADTEWPLPLQTIIGHHKEFPVTCNGSFFRPEVRLYRDMLRTWERPADKKKCVLVPCAAAKPYPAPLHMEVLTRIAQLPDAKEWHVIVATGVLGLVPQELWSKAPHYDSGLPNLDRVTQTVTWFFSRWCYERVVVYSDFYAHAISLGVSFANPATHRTDHTPEPRDPSKMYAPNSARPLTEFLFGNNYRDTYENTMLVEHLDRLDLVLRRKP